MKHKNFIYFLMLICTTVVGLWVLPALLHKATYTPEKYPFVYYSSLLEQFGLMNYSDKEMPMTDMQGNRYTEHQADSLLPLLNYRQLASDGRLPKSIKGVEIDQRIIRMNSVVFRYNPKDVSSPDPGLYILFESMPKRVGLSLPPDVFRLHNDIEFIDAQTNRIDRAKSDKFRQAMDKAGFIFPAQWSIGNPNPRKAYDEGYFSLDAKGGLFHIKMVNDRPYVRDTREGRNIDIASFSMYEVANKRFYGFLIDKEGSMYILESDEKGGYHTLRLDMETFDPASDQVTIMGNLLYWTVTVSSEAGRKYYALENETLRQVAYHFIASEPGRWDHASRWLFPLYLTFRQSNTNFLSPQLHFAGYQAFAVNLFAALIYLIFANGCSRKKYALSIFILLTGLAGLLAVAVLPGLRKKQQIKKIEK